MGSFNFTSGKITTWKSTDIFNYLSNSNINAVADSGVVHANNKENNIFVMGDAFVQGINDTTLYVEKMYSVQLVQNLHYSGDNSYLFLNGKQELKFKTKTESLVKEKLCIGNLSDKWSTSESEKAGLYGNTYDFVVDYEAII